MEGISIIGIWGILFIAFLVAEIVTAGALVSIWFCVGAGAAMFSAWLGVGIPVQIIIFVTVSLVLLFLTKPFVKRFIRTDASRVNADRIIGCRGIVDEGINNLDGKGSVRVDGKLWTARGTSGETVIPTGTTVMVDSIEGVKLMVYSVEERKGE